MSFGPGIILPVWRVAIALGLHSVLRSPATWRTVPSETAGHEAPGHGPKRDSPFGVILRLPIGNGGLSPDLVRWMALPGAIDPLSPWGL